MVVSRARLARPSVLPVCSAHLSRFLVLPILPARLAHITYSSHPPSRPSLLPILFVCLAHQYWSILRAHPFCRPPSPAHICPLARSVLACPHPPAYHALAVVLSTSPLIRLLSPSHLVAFSCATCPPVSPVCWLLDVVALLAYLSPASSHSCTSTCPVSPLRLSALVSTPQASYAVYFMLARHVLLLIIYTVLMHIPGVI